MPSSRLLLLVNPRAGVRARRVRIRQTVEHVVQRWRKAGIETEVCFTAHAGHAREIVAARDLGGLSGLCIYGGDGSLREVVSGLMARSDSQRVPLGMLPGGTGNSVLSHLECEDFEQAAQAIDAGATLPLDVARVALEEVTTYSVNPIGWCAAAEISRLADGWRWLGAARYTLAALWQVACTRPQRMVVTLDDRREEDDFLLVVACNTRYGGRKMLLAPQARIDDGLLDVLLVRSASRRQMLELLRRVRDGSHIELPFVELRRARRLRIASACQSLTLDGDVAFARAAEIEVVPAALQIFGGKSTS